AWYPCHHQRHKVQEPVEILAACRKPLLGDDILQNAAEFSLQAGKNLLHNVRVFSRPEIDNVEVALGGRIPRARDPITAGGWIEDIQIAADLTRSGKAGQIERR